jgi:glutamate-1-semialdehyde 2,1-aminomutase
MYKKFKKNNKKLQNYAHKIIPGLSGLLGKRPEMYLPGGSWPTYYSKAKGLHVWDLQGKKYSDFTMLGVGSCVFGYADREINEVAKKVISEGPLTTLNPPEEILLAEKLLQIHNWADQVKFARTGGEMNAVAVRLARSYTKREKILICGYHGWHDWYLATNINGNKNLNNHLLPGLEPKGVPKGLDNTVIPFNFNKCSDITNIVRKHASEAAAIVIEPARNTLACKFWLETLRSICDKNGCILIFDEITCGWRNDTSGIHLELGVNPDLATFGKTMANGIPMSALIGKKEIMEEAKNSFISSTNWTERLGPACALAFIEKHKRLNLGKILKANGEKIRKIWSNAADNAELNISMNGILPLSSFKIETNKKIDEWPIIITYFIQEMLKEKILASDRCFSNYCQTERELSIYKKACDKIFKKISHLSKKEKLEENLNGPVKQMGFKRLN